jgi:protein gp37
MVKCYIGKPGGLGKGIHRDVFYSNVAEPRIREIFMRDAKRIAKNVEQATNISSVKKSIENKGVARRLDNLRKIISSVISGDEE